MSAEKTPIHFKLRYFDCRARAEPARLILAYSGRIWEEERIAEEDWPKIKPTTPMGQLPVLEVDGKPLAQSMAIARYLAKFNGIAGANDWESALCDMLVDGIFDTVYIFVRTWFREKDSEKKKNLWENMIKNEIPPILQRYEDFLKKNGSGYFVGNKISWADLTISEWMAFFHDRVDGILDKYPGLKKHMEKIRSLPNIAKWVENRPLSEF